MRDNPLLRLVWGCDSALQYESDWIRFLLGTSLIDECSFLDRNFNPQPKKSGFITVLVETGLLRLERNPSPSRISLLIAERHKRVQILSSFSPLVIIHLSDEEGFDADMWYPMLPEGTLIWRNFYHPRLLSHNLKINYFPIGPRSLFLQYVQDSVALSMSSHRSFPWTFMGTLWSSGSRFLAVSRFLYSLPNGFYFGGQHFGQGLPLDQYRLVLCNSSFSLAPEGDRHLDTFRLWESLCCGSIPLIVEHNDTSRFLLPADFPIPIFSSWSDSVDYVLTMLAKPVELNFRQALLDNWWSNYIQSLRNDFLRTLHAMPNNFHR